MKLLERQFLFAQDMVELQSFILSQGYQFKYGDFFRDSRVHGKWGERISYSSSRSLHKLGLAGDLIIFKDGKYLTQSEDYEFAGKFWKELRDINEWGGENNREDGNHFSQGFQGLW